MTIVNLETIIDMQSWCRTWPPNGSNLSRAKQKVPGSHKGACKSSWSRKGSLTSFTLTIPWIWQSLWRSFLDSLYVDTTDRKQMGLLREQYAEWKKIHLQYCCNQVWMKIGGQILWNVTPNCETFKISYLMGRPRMRDVLDNLLRDLLFHLVHWLSITL